METSKKAEFVRKMGKKKLKLTKRKNMDLGGLLGMAGGAGGTGFSTSAGTNALQLNRAYDQSQNALTNQNNLTSTLTPQAQTAVNAQNVIAGQYANQAAGNGPNVAQNQLNQATGANVANTAAEMAGQRGAGANPALIAREAAQRGAQTQQTAAGQAATLGAEQQIAAEGAGAQLAGNQIAQTQGATNANAASAQNEQNILQGANTANNTNQAGLANTTMQGQQGLLGGALKGVGAISSLFEKGGEVHGHKKLDFVHKMAKMGLEHFHDGGEASPKPTPDDSSIISGPPQANAADVVPANVNREKMQGIMSGFRQTKSDGGIVKNYDDGGPVLAGAQSAQDSLRKSFHFAEGGLTVPQVTYNAPQNPFIPSQVAQGGFSSGPNAGADALAHAFDSNPKKEKNPMSGAKPMDTMAGETMPDPNMQNAAQGGEMHPKFQGPNQNMFANYFMASGGEVPAMVSPGEIRLTKEQVERVVHNDEDPAKIGYKYGGKAKVKGDSKKNDIIPETLQEGDVIIDREHMGSPEKRKLFVHKAIAKKRAKR